MSNFPAEKVKSNMCILMWDCVSTCLSNHLSLNPIYREQQFKGMRLPVLLSNLCASFNPKLCQDLRETEHPLTAGAPPKTCFSCPAEAPCTGDPTLNPLQPSLSPAIKDSFIICWLILCLPPKRLPGNRCAGSPSSSAPLHITRSETLRPQDCVSPPTKGPLRSLSLHYTSPTCMERRGSRGGGGGVGDQILNLHTRRGASTGTGSDITFECPDRGHIVVPLQLNYPAHNGEASRTDTSIESVSAALWGPTISISAEIDLLPKGATIAEQSF